MLEGRPDVRSSGSGSIVEGFILGITTSVQPLEARAIRMEANFIGFDDDPYSVDTISGLFHANAPVEVEGLYRLYAIVYTCYCACQQVSTFMPALQPCVGVASALCLPPRIAALEGSFWWMVDQGEEARGQPKFWVKYSLRSAVSADPTPAICQAGVRMFLRWPGLFIHPSTASTASSS